MRKGGRYLDHVPTCTAQEEMPKIPYVYTAYYNLFLPGNFENHNPFATCIVYAYENTSRNM